MGWFRNEAGRAPTSVAWDGPFAPAAATDPVKFDPMVRTAAELVASHDDVPAVTAPAVVPAASVAA